MKSLNIIFCLGTVQSFSTSFKSKKVCKDQELEQSEPKSSPGERGGLVVNASNSRSRGRGFEPHSGQTVLFP